MSDWQLGSDEEHRRYRQQNVGDTNMHLRTAFPSKWLAAHDLGGRAHVVTIDRITQEQVGQGQRADSKLVVYFVGKTKGMILNVTNANSIAAIAGSEETDDWSGAEIELFSTDIEFQGKVAPAIRVRAPKKARPAVTRPLRAPEPEPEPDEPELDDNDALPDDEIPF